MSITSPENILLKYWGYSQFRPLQKEIIETVTSKKNALVLMPTGGGKSVCYQIPALLQEGICIVISPLIALMEDQITQLKNRGIKALSIPSGLSKFDLETILNNAEYGNYKFLYLSPERLQQELVQNRIQKMNVCLIAIDEAHCISEWGHDFRPAYLRLTTLRDLQPKAPIIALTATATKKVEQDILHQLNLKSYTVYKTSYLRKNLSYGVYKTQDKKYLLLQILKKQKGCAIVYVPTRNQTEEISALLNQSNIKALPYHGGLNSTLKKKHFNLWMDNTIPVIVATNAFGMGIDKSNVRMVIHMHLPMSIENYFQEAGRAGRDGKQAFALLLQTGNTSQKLIQQFEAQTPTIDFVKFVYRKLSSYLQIGYGEGFNQSFSLSFSNFCNRYKINKTKTYNTLKVLDKNSLITFNEVFTRFTLIQITTNSNTFYNYIYNNIAFTKIGDFLIRSYSGIFTNPVTISLSRIASEIGLSVNNIELLLEKLAQQDLISIENKKHDITIHYLRPREDNTAINSVAKHIKQQIKYKKKKITNIISFLDEETTCKSKYLLKYFGEDTTECGICSACIKKRKAFKPNVQEAEKAILSILNLKNIDSRTLTDKLPIFKHSTIIEALKVLLSNHKISILPDNTYCIKK